MDGWPDPTPSYTHRLWFHRDFVCSHPKVNLYFLAIFFDIQNFEMSPFLVQKPCGDYGRNSCVGENGDISISGGVSRVGHGPGGRDWVLMSRDEV